MYSKLNVAERKILYLYVVASEKRSMLGLDFEATQSKIISTLVINLQFEIINYITFLLILYEMSLFKRTVLNKFTKHKLLVFYTWFMPAITKPAVH
jgi:hypothetical protein